jgi:replicative DNA helicase
LDKLSGKPDKSRWLFTGLKSFDERFGAFDANNEDWLVVIGAFQGGAKSSFMRCCLLLTNLRAGKTAHVFLLETGIGKLLELLACTAADIGSNVLAGLPPDLRAKYQRALDEMHGYLGKTLFVCDEVIPVETLIARIDDHARRQGPADLIAIDHLHLLSSLKPHGKREAEMGYIAKSLARCGKRHNRTIFALAQLNRSARADGKNLRPEPHNLRDSGEIEQAARRIILLHTPDSDMRGAEQTKNQDQVMMEIYQAKHNNGSAGYREAWFRRSVTKFFDISTHEAAAERRIGDLQKSAAAAPGGVTKADFRKGQS